MNNIRVGIDCGSGDKSVACVMRNNEILWIGEISPGSVIPITKRKRKMKKQKIYWYEKQQQIKTKGGKCLFAPEDYYIKCEVDKKVRDGDVELLSRDLAKVERQLQCAAKAHKMVFDRVREGEWSTCPSFPEMIKDASLFGTGVSHTRKDESRFIFKCSDCGLEITKTAKELTATEKEALRKLKLL